MGKEKDTKSTAATFTLEIVCPHEKCGKGIIVKHFREVVIKPVPGEYKEYDKVTKDPQKGLGFEGTADGKTQATKKKPKSTRKVGGNAKSGGKKPHEAVRG